MSHRISKSKVADRWFAMYEKFGKEIKSNVAGRARERELIAAAQAGDEDARLELLARNTPLIIDSVARFTRPGIDADDRVQVAFMGFSKGIDRYNLARNHGRLCTYAIWWADQALQEISPQAYTIRIPHGVIGAMSRFKKSGRDTPEPKPWASAETVMAAVAVSTRTVSLDAPLEGDHDDRTLMDFIVDRHFEGSEDEKILREMAFDKIMAAARNCLTPRELDILLLYMDGKTLVEVGKIHNLTRERVRQINYESIRRIRKALAGRPCLADKEQRAKRQNTGGPKRGLVKNMKVGEAE